MRRSSGKRRITGGAGTVAAGGGMAEVSRPAVVIVGSPITVDLGPTATYNPSSGIFEATVTITIETQRLEGERVLDMIVNASKRGQPIDVIITFHEGPLTWDDLRVLTASIRLERDRCQPLLDTP